MENYVRSREHRAVGMDRAAVGTRMSSGAETVRLRWFFVRRREGREGRAEYALLSRPPARRRPSDRPSALNLVPYGKINCRNTVDSSAAPTNKTTDNQTDGRLLLRMLLSASGFFFPRSFDIHGRAIGGPVVGSRPRPKLSLKRGREATMLRFSRQFTTGLSRPFVSPFSAPLSMIQSADKIHRSSPAIWLAG